MDERTLRELIHQTGDEQISERVNLWPGIKEQLTVTPHRRLPRTRKGWLIALLAALLTVGVVAAVDQVLNLRGDAGLESANQQGLVSHLDMTKQDGDISVTLDFAYADANRITVAYTFNALVSPEFKGSVNAIPSLRDDQGHRFEAIISGGGGGGGGGEEGPTPTAVLVSTTSEYSYDVLESLGDVDALNLTLQVDVYQSDDPSLMQIETATLLTTFEFPFTLPFNKGLVLETAQTATANGISMRLERVVVAPSMTRIVLCFDPPPPMSEDRWWPEIDMTANGKPTASGDNQWYPFTPEVSANPLPENCLIETLSQDLSTLKGDWTLTVPDLYTQALPPEAAQDYTLKRIQQFGVEVIAQPEGGYTYNPPEGMDHTQLGQLIQQTYVEMTARIPGPWVFHFKLE